MKEKRLARLSVETRADASNENEMTLAGRPIVFEQETRITDPDGTTYNEIIARGALDYADINDSTLFYNHDTNRVPLARTPKTMQLTRTKDGLEMLATLADTTQAREVYAAVKRGDLAGMSFAFTVPEGGSSYNRETNTRRITRIDKIYEVSVVPFPAYPQTSIEARGIIKELQTAARERAVLQANSILLKEWF